MDAIVETDNLRRDFTFNIKITRANMDIYVAKGAPLGCFLPYPRYFLDEYKLAELVESEERARSVQTIQDFGRERAEFDYNHPRLRYMEGKDIYDTYFDEHQKTLDSGEWWKSNDARLERQKGKKADDAKRNQQCEAKPKGDENDIKKPVKSEKLPKAPAKKFKKNRKHPK